MFTIGIDPGSSITACAFVNLDTKESYFDYLKLDKNLSHEKKMHEVFLYIKHILSEHPVQSVAVEGSFYSVNVQSALLLSQIRAAVIIGAMESGYYVYQYLPRQVKQAVCGYGNASKEQVRFVVEKTLGIDLSSEPLDVSDAFAIALTHIYSSGRGGKHTAGGVYGRSF